MVRKEEMSCFTFLPLHFGHRAFFLSYSTTVMVSVNFFLHFSHMNSYVGMVLTSCDMYTFRVVGHEITACFFACHAVSNLFSPAAKFSGV